MYMASGKVTNILQTPVTKFTGVPNSDYCISANIYGYQFGRIAWLSGWIRLKTDATIGITDVLVSGVPKAADNVNVLYCDQNNGIVGSFYIENNSTNIIKSSYPIAEHLGNYLNFACVYMTKD